MWAVSTFSLTVCLLVAAIIATTDPSAVTAVFREVGARRRLTLLVEGESLLNDAAAIALFTTLLASSLQPSHWTSSVVATEIGSAWPSSSSAGHVVGAAILGRVAAIVVSRIDQGGPAEVTLSVALAYLSYAFAETYLHVSGRGRRGRGRAGLRNHRPDARRHQGMAERQRHLDPARLLGELARVRAGLDAGPDARIRQALTERLSPAWAHFS